MAHSFSWDSLEMRIKNVIEPLITLWSLEYWRRLVIADLEHFLSFLRELVSHRYLGEEKSITYMPGCLKTFSIFFFFFAKPFRHVGRLLMTAVLRCKRCEFRG